MGNLNLYLSCLVQNYDTVYFKIIINPVLVLTRPLARQEAINKMATMNPADLQFMANGLGANVSASGIKIVLLYGSRISYILLDPLNECRKPIIMRYM